MFSAVPSNNIVSTGTASGWSRISEIPELLSIIFIFCLPSHNMIPSEHIAPVLLTHICRRWRRIALSTPQLWSRLRLRMPVEHAGDAEALRILRQFRQMLRVYLSRVGSVEISLDIDLLNGFYMTGATHGDTRNRLVSSIISETLPFSHQWRHLSLVVPLQPILPVLALVGHGSASRLDSLTLDFSCDSGFHYSESDTAVSRPFPIVLDLAHCERLSLLTIYGNSDDNVIIRWKLEGLPNMLSGVMLWDVRLETFSMDGLVRPLPSSLRRLSLSALITPKDLLCLLEASPELVDLTLDLQFPSVNNGWNWPEYLVHLRSLRRLRISVGEGTSGLFNIIDPPCLAFLELTVEHVQTPEEILSLLMFARRLSALKEEDQ